MPTKDIVVIYHIDCADGFGGAWAAWKYFGNKAEYVAIEPGSRPVAGLRNKEIYLIDVSYRERDLRKLIKLNKRVTAIDHHVSAQPFTKMTQHYSYAIGHSGAVLAWKYFHPKSNAPRALRHIEDFDLWKFKLPYTKEITAFLDLFNFEFKTWSRLIAMLDQPRGFKKAVAMGKIVLAHESKLVERLVSVNAEPVKFEGHKILAVNSPQFCSEIGNALYKMTPPIGIVWSERAGQIDVSLRSDGSVDVAKIAVKYGGGGHRQASGFSWPLGRKLPWKVIK